MIAPVPIILLTEISPMWLLSGERLTEGSREGGQGGCGPGQERREIVGVGEMEWGCGL